MSSSMSMIPYNLIHRGDKDTEGCIHRAKNIEMDIVAGIEKYPKNYWNLERHDTQRCKREQASDNTSTAHSLCTA